MIICPYCDSKAELVTGMDIYPHIFKLWKKKFYHCAPCDAYVGCHPKTEKPLGRLADRKLRLARVEAHAAFDPIWKDGKMSRADAYKWLSEKMELTEKQCHIGEFDITDCYRLVYLVKFYIEQGETK